MELLSSAKRDVINVERLINMRYIDVNYKDKVLFHLHIYLPYCLEL